MDKMSNEILLCLFSDISSQLTLARAKGLEITEMYGVIERQYAMVQEEILRRMDEGR